MGRLSRDLDLDESLTRTLLNRDLDSATTFDPLLAAAFVDSDSRTAIDSSLFPNQFRALCRLHKAAYICRKLGIDTSELHWIHPADAPPPVFTVLDLNGLPSRQGDAAAAFSLWQNLVRLYRLRDSSSPGRVLLLQLETLLTTTPPTVLRASELLQQAWLAAALNSNVEDVAAAAAAPALNLAWPADYANAAKLAALPPRLFVAATARVMQVSTQDVVDAMARLTLAWPAALRDPANLANLFALLAAVQRLGVRASEVFSLVKDAAAAEPAPAIPGEAEAALARRILRARYDEQSWPRNLKAISDALREKQRDALVGYLIANPPANTITPLWRDANSLYAHYLIDTEMGSCRLSSRLLHAISAVQLFVQRCLLNLEKDVSPALIDGERWPWLKNYRVWEANRKVFLYPENWIEPQLRDDKSEQFEALEGQLLQNELDADRAADVVMEYLKDLEQVARIATVGLYVEKPLNANGAPSGETVFHVVGRTRNQPAGFHYRQWRVSPIASRWTSWEHLPLDGVKTDHVLPFVLRGEVYIAWPEITQLAAKASGSGPDASPGAKWRLQMSWIRRGSGKWSNRYRCGDILEHSWIAGKDENESFTFRALGEKAASADASFAAIDCLGALDTGNFKYSVSTADETPVVSNAIAGAWNTVPKTDPWITVKCSGAVFREYTSTGQSVFVPASGIHMRLTISIGGGSSVVQTFENEFYWRGYSWPDYPDYPQAIDHVTQPPNSVIYLTNDSVYTDANGAFEISLPQLVARAMYHPDVLNADPQVRLDVLTGTGTNPPSKTFSFAGAVTGVHGRLVTFHKNFVIPGIGDAPGSQPERPLPMTRLAQFRVFDAEDALIEKLDPITWFPPTNITSHGSGYLATNANTADALKVPENSSVSVWTGAAKRYYLLPSFPTSSGTHYNGITDDLTYAAPEAFVYRDSDNSYFVRRDSGTTDSYQVVLDGHPRAGALRMAVAQRGLGSLFDLVQQDWASPTALDGHSPATALDLANSLLNPAIRFDSEEPLSPFASYNTELFFHVPFLVACALSSNQRFEEAQRWFHYIFDPTTADTTPGVERFWRYLPFRKHTVTTPIDDLLRALSDPALANDPRRTAVLTQLQVWEDNPFRPHAVARSRIRAYQFSVLFKYLDNLIAWGDQLFRRYTTELLNEATQLYIIAANLLGPRPQTIPRRAQPEPLTWRRAAGNWDRFANTWLEVEANVASGGGGTLRIGSGGGGSSSDRGTGSLSTIGMLYFCVPGNEKMLEYWDKVEQRLFNIRHCRNIDGVPQTVALFQPPIDPALLVRAVAAGLDIADVLAEADAPLPYYRFSTMAQKASELCNEVKALSGLLLATLEKKDAEQLALLRSTRELELLDMVRLVRQQQIDEADANIAALRKSEDTAIARFRQFQRLLGNAGAEVPDDPSADVEQSSMAAPSSGASGDLGGLGLTQAELDQIKLSEAAVAFGLVAGIHNIISGIGYAIPSTQAGTPFLSATYGGMNLGSILNAGAAFWTTLERGATYQATRVATVGQYQRRQDDWVLQSRLALKEIQQVRRQIAAASLRREIAAKELDNHDKQASNAQEIDRFMRDKYTNLQLYQWMVQQVSGVYFQAYQLAYDVAKRAERAFRFELGLAATDYIQPTNWDSLKKGLLSGERLTHDLKRMEVAYLEQNRREFELTQHVSLLALDPVALIALRQTGQCEFSIPEALFDLSHGGHYLRRIKSVAVTVPCVTGPYVGVNCTVTLLKSSIRYDADVSGGYAFDDEADSDTRIVDAFGPIQSIATSSGQQDSGLFETNLRDERFLPFEGAGVISTWRLELPDDFRAFDYNTIADVILHIRYTSRDGGEDMKRAARAELATALSTAQAVSGSVGLTRAFSLRYEFPTAWQQFKASADAKPTIEFTVSKGRFPFLFARRGINITAFEMRARAAAGAAAPDLPTLKWTLPDATATPLGLVGPIDGFASKGYTTNVQVAAKDDDGKWKLEISAANPLDAPKVAAFQKGVDDLLVVCHYTV